MERGRQQQWGSHRGKSATRIPSGGCECAWRQGACVPSPHLDLADCLERVDLALGLDNLANICNTPTDKAYISTRNSTRPGRDLHSISLVPAQHLLLLCRTVVLHHIPHFDWMLNPAELLRAIHAWVAHDRRGAAGMILHLPNTQTRQRHTSERNSQHTGLRSPPQSPRHRIGLMHASLTHRFACAPSPRC